MYEIYDKQWGDLALYIAIFHRVPLNSDSLLFIIKYELILKISMAYLFIGLFINSVFIEHIL